MNIILFARKNWAVLATILFSLVMGVLLLVNPSVYTIALIRLAGILLLVLGVFDVVKYFRTDAEEAAKGSAFYSGVTQIAVGCFCLFGVGWFLTVFPVLAVLYGLLQILIGFRKLQRMTDAIRARRQLWYLRAISAFITLLFGLLVVLIPNWVLAGIALLAEGIFDCVALVLQQKKTSSVPTARGETDEKARG